MRRRLAPALALLLAALAAAAPALADKEQVKLTAAGNAAARAAVIGRSDLAGASGWSGGPVKPDLSSAPPCKGFRPKQSDLVIVGAARTVWRNSSIGIGLDSEVQVLRSARMVRLDWKRTVLAPQVLGCLRSGIAKRLDPRSTLVSMRVAPFPRVAPYTRLYRVVLRVETTSGATTRVLVDILLVGSGRSELTLTTTAPYSARTAIVAAEEHLARALVARMPSGPVA